jgi:predicted DNA-binding transcriptional regulator AlpA
MLKDLLPQKRVAAELGISRSSLWRASRSFIPGFPSPIVLRARIYWREADLPALKAALQRFQGRKAFEKERRHAKACAARAEAAGRKPKRGRRAEILRQPDLFGDADAAAPLGAEKGSPP